MGDRPLRRASRAGGGRRPGVSVPGVRHRPARVLRLLPELARRQHGAPRRRLLPGPETPARVSPRAARHPGTGALVLGHRLGGARQRRLPARSCRLRTGGRRAPLGVPSPRRREGAARGPVEGRSVPGALPAPRGLSRRSPPAARFRDLHLPLRTREAGDAALCTLLPLRGRSATQTLARGASRSRDRSRLRSSSTRS